jgi:PAS domain S-box-containing protein
MRRREPFPWLRSIAHDKVAVWLVIAGLMGGLASGAVEIFETNSEGVVATAHVAEIAAALVNGTITSRVEHIEGMVHVFESSDGNVQTLVEAAASEWTHTSFRGLEYFGPDGRTTSMCSSCPGLTADLDGQVLEIAARTEPGGGAVLSYDEASDFVVMAVPVGTRDDAGVVVGAFTLAGTSFAGSAAELLPSDAVVGVSPSVPDVVPTDRRAQASRVISVDGLRLLVTVTVADRSLLNSRAIPIALVVTLCGLLIAGAAHELSERRRVAGELESAKAVWDVPVGVFVSSTDGHLVSANDTYLTMFGYESHASAVGFDEISLWPTPEHRTRLLEQLRRFGHVDGLETTLVRLDGSEFPARVWVRMVSDSGELRGAVEDVTEERMAREAVERSRDEFRALFESSPTATQIQDLTVEARVLQELKSSGVDVGTYFAERADEAADLIGSEVIVGSNPAMVRLLGAANDEELNGGLLDRTALVLLPGSASAWLEAFAASPNRGTCRLPMGLLGREAIFQLNWAIPTINGSLDFSRVIVTFTDITEIEAERARYEALFESSPVAMRLLDLTPTLEWLWSLKDRGVNDIVRHLSAHPHLALEGLGRSIVTAANPAAAALFQMDRGRLLGALSGQPSLVAMSSEAAVDAVRALVDGVAEYGLIEELHRPDGTIRHLQVRLIAPELGGRMDFERVVEAFVDITEVEEARRRAEELAKLKSRLIASVSHELRTPLTAVVGFSGVLESDLPALPDEVAEMVGLIASTSRQMGGIVEDLLTAARVDLGEVEIAPSVLKLGEEARATLPTVDVGGREVTFVMDDSEAWADRGRVRQIVRNLMTNAVRYGKGPIRVHAFYRRGDAVLRVSDRGAGVPAEVESDLFEPYRTFGKAAGHTESVGLGLSLSRHLARRMGGDLVYLRDAGETVFELMLPAWEPERAFSSAGT